MFLRKSLSPLLDPPTNLPKKGIDIPGLVSAHYEQGPTKGIVAGQIVWIPALYPNKNNVVIDIDVASDPTETRLPAFLRPLAQKQNHFPVKSLNLGSNEHAFVLTGKMRPAIILVEDTTQWARSPAENLTLCVPLFRVAKPKFLQSFVLKSQAFLYPSKFYLPPDPTFGIDESVARFELIQTVHQFVLGPFPDIENPAMLTDEFFVLLRIQLTRFFGGVLLDDEQETLDVYGQLILEEAKKQGVVI
jgi:hypothetical protein